MAAKPKRGPPQTAPDDDEIPQDIDANRRELARKIGMYVANVRKRWRSCGEPSCKRARSCCAPRGRCSNRPPNRRTMKPEHEARSRAKLYRSIREAADRIDAERTARETADRSHQKT